MEPAQDRAKIVLVDDNLANLSIGRDMLKAKYEVFPASSAAKLFEILENVKPEMILLDVEMPEMNGFEVLKRLKADPRHCDIAVIFVTVKRDEASELEGLSLGAIDYVHKPFSAPLLLKRIENHLAKKRADEANLIKSSFLASMSHEIRTPMNAIIGMAELLMHEPLNAHQMGFVNDINASAHSLLSIINDILDLSKIETGKFELRPVDYDFNLFIGNIATIMTYLAEKKNIDFKFVRESDLPPVLFGDEIRLRQVLTNICGNAVKFTDRGYVRLYVGVKEGALKFEVTDTGRGIRKDDLPKLFDVYAQSDSLKNRAIVGTGLGLAISKSFVEMMGGAITVDSVDGHGSVFTVTVPLVPGDPANTAQGEAGTQEQTICAPDAEILVVDDNEFNLRVASGLLGLSKIKAKTALSGPAAIDLVQMYDFDIVFMDHMMPHMDGVMATKIIRELGGKYRLLPIIALTATAIKGAREMFLSNGFNGFLSKPVEMRDFQKTLAEWLPPSKIMEKAGPPESSGPEADAAESGDFLDIVRGIREINTEIGLSRFSGMEGLYRDTLEDFCGTLLPKCDKMQEFLGNSDIGGFAIAVHAMKSELATVGAMRLSEMAFKLESAAKNKELDFCLGQYPVLQGKLTALHEQLSAAFPAPEAAPKEKGDPALLTESVKTAQTAADDFDSDAGVQAISDLLAYDYGEETNDLLGKAAAAFKNFDCAGALDALDKIRLD